MRPAALVGIASWSPAIQSPSPSSLCGRCFSNRKSPIGHAIQPGLSAFVLADLGDSMARRTIRSAAHMALWLYVLTQSDTLTIRPWTSLSCTGSTYNPSNLPHCVPTRSIKQYIRSGETSASSWTRLPKATKRISYSLQPVQQLDKRLLILPRQAILRYLAQDPQEVRPG